MKTVIVILGILLASPVRAMPQQAGVICRGLARWETGGLHDQYSRQERNAVMHACRKLQSQRKP